MTMKTPGGCWWIAALLVMAVGAEVLVDSLTAAERKVVERVRENFHNNRRHAFQVTKILNKKNKKHPEGTFVTINFTMKRTNCKKHEWMNKDCAPIMTAKKTYNCLGCFIFNSSGEILRTGYQKCVLQRRAHQEEVREKRQKACAKVENSPHLVGGYSFQRAPRGQYDD